MELISAAKTFSSPLIGGTPALSPLWAEREHRGA